jgi:Ca2+-binding EF-hand superfamily protein
VDDLIGLRQELDPDRTGWVQYDLFLPFAQERMEELQDAEADDDEHMQEVQKAYDLFTHNGPGPIHVAHLRMVASKLKEKVTDEQLMNMVRVANGRPEREGWKAGVTMTEFEKVLDAAGLWKRS